MLIAFFLVSPVAIGGLFAFARFADRHFQDSPAPEGERFRDLCAPRPVETRRRKRERGWCV